MNLDSENLILVLGNKQKRKGQKHSNGPLNGNDISEGFLCGVGHEDTDDSKCYTLYGYGEENEAGLYWPTKVERRNLVKLDSTFGEVYSMTYLRSVRSGSCHGRANSKTIDHFPSKKFTPRY